METNKNKGRLTQKMCLRTESTEHKGEASEVS